MYVDWQVNDLHEFVCRVGQSQGLGLRLDMGNNDQLEHLRSRASEVSGLLKLLASPNRLLIACELMEGERSVSQLEAHTGVRQPNLSRDLARLRAEGLVVTRREAKKIYYSLVDERLKLLLRALCDTFAADLKSPKASEVMP